MISDAQDRCRCGAPDPLEWGPGYDYIPCRNCMAYIKIKNTRELSPEFEKEILRIFNETKEHLDELDL